MADAAGGGPFESLTEGSSLAVCTVEFARSVICSQACAAAFCSASFFDVPLPRPSRSPATTAMLEILTDVAGNYRTRRPDLELVAG